MIKVIFIITVIIYSGVICIWIYKFPISYKLTNGTYHDIIVDHDFTKTEREEDERAFHIRQIISNIVQYSSIIICIGSYIILRKQWIKQTMILKVALYTSGFITILLMLINGIHFIPNPPIR